jgi:transglutaminase-like putative cysteine protease
MKKSLTYIIFLIIFPIFLGLTSYAADFKVKVSREYFVDSSDSVRVVETHTINNNHTTKWIGEDNTESFFVSVTAGTSDSLNKTLSTVVVKLDGQSIASTKEIKGDYAIVSAKLGKAIKPGGSAIFIVEYINSGLIEKKGALVDFYAPGYKIDTTTDSQTSTEYVFDTYVNVSKILPEINFVIPVQKETSTSSTYTRYYFDYESLVDKYIWVQIGRKQYYKFAITQNVNATDSSSVYTNEYRLIVPRDIDEPQIYQKVYFTKIDPAPNYVEEDEDGNIVLIIKKPATENSDITIEGYAEVGRNSVEINKTSGDLQDIDQGAFERYLIEDRYLVDGNLESHYWQVNSSLIKDRVESVVVEDENIISISQKLYDHVISTIDYSKVKRFGLNERQGALKTLNGGAAVCMEYSDLFLTMTRNVGIPTRAVFGYGYDSKIQNDKQEAHQWVQIYLPKLAQWASIDVTWGESGLKMSEGNLNHFFTHVATVNPDTPALVERRTFSTGQATLQTPVYVISAVEQIINDSTDIQTQTQLLNLYPEPPEDTSKSVANIFANLAFIKNINISTIMIGAGILLMVGSVFGIVKMMRDEEK